MDQIAGRSTISSATRHWFRLAARGPKAHLADDGSASERRSTATRTPERRTTESAPHAEPPEPQPEHVDLGNTSDVEDDYMAIDVSELDDADVAQTGVERLLEAFPGAKVLRTESER